MKIFSSKPRQEGYLPVSEIHELFYALYGNPNGIPVVILHGGPGRGTNIQDCRFFDLDKYNVIVFDQRGAMRSKPYSCMEDNTTQNCIEDIEKLRKHLEIDQWIVFGGSWGSLLGVLYGQEHSNSCLGFILSGVLLGRPEDINFFKMEKGAEDVYEEFLLNFPEEERHDLLAACYKRAMDPDPAVRLEIARAFLRFRYMSINNFPSASRLKEILEDDRYVLSAGRTTLYYTAHQFFIGPNQVLSNMDRISHLPAIIVQGKADKATYPEQALLLHQGWKGSRLWMVDAGHETADPILAEALYEAIRTLESELVDGD